MPKLKNSKSAVLIMVLFFLCGSVKAQLKADFSVNINAGCTPLLVQFSDSSTGSPTEWSWDFGDGIKSKKQNPGNLYFTPGVYDITLTVKNATGTSTLTKTAYINVYAKPDVKFSVLPPTEGCAPLPVQFSDETTAGSGTIKQEVWDFGDGQIFVGTNPLHTYTSSDTFSVILTVENSYGCKQTVQQQTAVEVYNNVIADFSYTYTNACQPPSTVTFKNLSTSKSAITYAWNFGDGATSNVKDPVHIYNSAGNYTAQLITTTDLGCTDTITKPIAIGNIAADFTLPAEACANKPLTFINSSTLQPVSVTWSFGDGGTATTIDATHTYASAGTYQVKMDANFGNCSSTITKAITIANKPVIDFNASGTLATCNFPVTIQFTNATTGAVNYVWYFGDKDSSIETSPSHTYAKAGFYTVSLVAINSNGCTDTLIKTDYIKLGPPKIDSLKGLPIQGCVPQTITPQAAISSGEPVATYLWDFGDGNTSTEAAPSHTYTIAGNYTVSLIVKTASGCTDTFSLSNAVNVGNKPVADFSADLLEGCATKVINFTDQSTGEVTNWSWDFGDGTTSAGQNTSHQYKDTGYFTVTLTVESNGCAAIVTKTDYIHISPPIALFDITIKCDENYKRYFTNKSIGAKTWSWDFGDGDSSNAPSPVHIYADTGLFYVKLTVTNGACTDFYLDTVNVIDQNPLFTIQPAAAELCKYDSVTFNAYNYNIDNILGFHWNFGDSTFAGFNINNTTIKHQYLKSGNFTPFMIIRYVNNCKDTVSFSPLNIKVYGPTPAFTNPEGTCVSGKIPFTDQSFSDGVHPISKWIWDYGDSTAPESFTPPPPPFEHTYSSIDSFDVKLVLYDTYGCKDSIVKKNAVIITRPIANFSVQDSLRCTTSTVNFVDSSKGVELNYNWNFGDGTTGTESDPMHLYATQKTYSVKLVIKDKFGCVDSIQKDNYITISNPKAIFILNDTFGVCPPLLVQPQNSSQNYESVLWDFKDGNTSIEFNPQHFYNTAGTYFLELIVKGYGECYDSASQKVLLKGPSGTFAYADTQACSPAKITFNATTKNTSTLIWGYGDGTVETTKNTTVEYTYTDYGKYLPKLILVDSSGCKVGISNTDSITISDVKTNFKIASQPGCDSALISFTDSSVAYLDSITSYQWNFGDGTSSFQTNPGHYYNKAGDYSVSLIVNTATGCADTLSLPVTAQVNESPQITLVVPDSGCIATPLDFKAFNVVNDDTVQWLWNLGNGSTDANQNPVVTYATSGLFNVKLSAVNQYGCTDSTSQQITILPAPVIDAGLDTVLCSGNAVQLLATGGTSYVWNTDASLNCINCANPTAKPDSSTTYYVQGASAFGCTALDSVFVEVKQPVILSLAQQDTLCLGKSIQLFASGAEVYNWQPPTGLSNPFIANPVASPATTTTYTLKGSDDKSCFSDTKSITIYVFPNPSFNIIDSSITLNLGGRDTLQTTSSPDVIRWQWSPPMWLDCIDCAQPLASPKGEITYTANAYNLAGCSATDQVTIKILCNGANIFVPNTFSPNKDGMNEKFFPRGNGDFSIRSFRVFNRWGQMVYEKSNIKPNIEGDGWNGSFKNTDVPEGVYVYVMELVCDRSNIYVLKGNVTLLR